MSLTAVDIASFVVTGALAASKLLSATQAFWTKLPKWLAVALPVIALNLPQVAAAFGLVQTGTSITTAIVASVALLLPGVAQAEVAAETKK